MDPPRPELVIFDCDGVLIDSEIISAMTLMELLAGHGLQIDLQHVQRHFLGRSFPTVAASIRNQFDLDLPASFESDYRRILLESFEGGLSPSDGIFAVLETLVVPYCVATSSSPERVHRSLKIAGLDRYFADHTYTASEVEKGKPAPDLFLHVAASEGFEPERCLVIEDSMPGVEAANAAGMSVLRYIGGSHFDGVRSHAEREAGGSAVFDSWSKFYDIVPSLRGPDSTRGPRGQQI
ncbi:HAD family hydrolase [Hoeflea sp. TYP-13]|uniref:HAD family hydrolase n=1 Tax=Hoeflea sp. TYP-13 TaxID=3230023 RepID=UPI0034C5F389